MLARFLFLCTFLVLGLAPLSAQNLIMVAGGGGEVDPPDTTSWSYKLYSRMVLNGDTNGDGVIEVAIVAVSLPAGSAANWMPDYFDWIGTTLGLNVVATNYEVKSTNKANSSSVVGPIADADVVFIKGGDQGEYYDYWNGTLLETNIRAVANRGGAIGGTSAGATSQSDYCLCGSMDLISADVMEDSHTSFLDDNNGGSGIHDDFLSFVSDVIIDSHFTERGRLGRLAGVLAKAQEDYSRTDLLGIGIEATTGLIITGTTAEVFGTGSVSFLRATSGSEVIRTPGKPLYFTDLRLDRLTEGWSYDLSAQLPITSTRPAGTSAISVSAPGTANSGSLSINGGTENDKNKFAYTGDYAPDDYARVAGTSNPYIRDSTGFTDAGASASRGEKHETLFRLLYDEPGDLGVLAFSGGTVSRASSGDVLEFAGTGTLLVDLTTASYKGLSPHISRVAADGGSLNAAAFVDATVHVMASSSDHGKGYDSAARTIVAVTGGPGGGGIDEGESNDSRSTALDLTGATFPLTITGTISSSSDRDYFKIQLASGETMNAALAVPDGVDYDLYFLDDRGRTLIRSINDGLGDDESLSYTNTSNKTKTCYVEVESYSGSTSTTYDLDLSK